MDKLFKELRRRNVFRVAGVYAVVGWFLAQLAGVLETSLGFPGWFDGVVVGLLLIGFPVSMVLAWAFEVTPEGVKLTRNGGEDESIDTGRGHRLDYAILAGLATVAALVVADRITGSPAENLGVPHGDPKTASPAPAEAASPATSLTAPAPIGRSRSIVVLPSAGFSPGGDQEGFSDDPAGPAEQSVAVLPFVALSSGEDDGYFADGLTEEILNALAALPDLLVSARTSSFFYKGKDVPVDEIAERLGVSHVVEGSVRRAGDKVRVTAQLIRAGDGFHLWSKTYDASMNDVFAVQTDIAEKVATALDILLDEEERALMRAAGVNNPEAYAIYAKGEELFRLAHGALPQIETLVRANREYDNATAAAPELWAASYNSADLYSHVLLQLAAGARLEDMPEGVGDDPAGALQQRLDAAMRHAPSQAARQSIDLTQRVFSNDWTGVADLVRTIYRNPEPCSLDQWAHAVGLAFGAAEQAVQYYTRSVKCNRLDGGDWTMASLAALYAGDPARSLSIIEEGRDVYDATLREEVAHLRALMANGRMAEARAGLSRVSGSDNLRASMEGELAAAMGDRAGALAARDRLVAEAAKDPDVFDAGLRLSAQAGDRETANALAAEVDARPAGPMLLLGAVYFCRCGAPFDLEATPTLTARLEEAGIAWPPASPVGWPLKDW